MPDPLEMDGPAEFGEFFLDVGEGVGERGAAVGTGGALGEDSFALEFEGLALAFAFGLFEVRVGDGRLRCSGARGLRRFLRGLDRFAFPAS